MIVELIRFSLESIVNLIFVIAMLIYILVLCVGTAGAFKPVNYTYLTNSKVNQIDTNELNETIN